MRVTPEATSLLLGFLGSPFDVGDALNRLDPETKAPEPRRVALDEVRFALSTMEADRLLPAATPGSRQIVAALLAADGELSTSRLARRADVQEATVREHRDRLEALGLLEVRELGEGRATLHRIRLPTRDERHEDAPAPPTLEPESLRGVSHVVEDVLNRLGDSVAVAAPELWGRIWPADGEDVDVLWREGSWRWLERWADLLAGFAGEEVGGCLEWGEGPYRRDVELGERIERSTSRQLSLDEALGLSPAD
jgi:DNA-binding transcriptional ArsR family regulator